MPKIFIANVGVNASHALKSPVFEDGSFEFIPIPEATDLRGTTVGTYADLRSFYNPREPLNQYIPERYWNHAAHNDPEFVTFTYGDNCQRAARAVALRSIREVDILLFYARLAAYKDGRFTEEAGFYFIGFIEVSFIASDLTGKPGARVLSHITNNAHVRRALSNAEYWNGFWVFKGSDRSIRFRTAVPLTRYLATRVFRTSAGKPWRWRPGKTDLQMIGSYLRSCRCCFDTEALGARDRAQILCDEMEAYNPAAGISRLLQG